MTTPRTSVCKSCDTPITGKAKTGCCRACANRAVGLARRRAAADALICPDCNGTMSRGAMRCMPCSLKAPRRRPTAVVSVPVFVSEEAYGSALLAEACHRLFAGVAAKKGCSVDAARIITLYSPEQIRAIAA